MFTPKKPHHTLLYAWLVRHSKSTFVLMSVTFILFGGLSVNLVSHFFANANYLFTYQWDALIDGGLYQLLELLAKATVALGSYVLFKLCEHALIERLAHPLADHDGSAIAVQKSHLKKQVTGKLPRLQVKKKVEE